MQAIVKEFFIPMGFCVVCAVGGWALGRDSAQARVAAGTNAGTIAHNPTPSAGFTGRDLDATGTMRQRQPCLIRCDGLRLAVDRRASTWVTKHNAALAG